MGFWLNWLRLLYSLSHNFASAIERWKEGKTGPAKISPPKGRDGHARARETGFPRQRKSPKA
jgi:hypothetical protein